MGAYNYNPSTDFAGKDSLPPSNPAKIILGSEHQTEFNNISSTVNQKYDSGDIATQGQAEAETDNTTLMTPLRTAQQIAANPAAPNVSLAPTATLPIDPLDYMLYQDVSDSNNTKRARANVLLGDRTELLQLVTDKTINSVTRTALAFSTSIPNAAEGLKANTFYQFEMFLAATVDASAVSNGLALVFDLPADATSGFTYSKAFAMRVINGDGTGADGAVGPVAGAAADFGDSIHFVPTFGTASALEPILLVTGCFFTKSTFATPPNFLTINIGANTYGSGSCVIRSDVSYLKLTSRTFA